MDAAIVNNVSEQEANRVTFVYVYWMSMYNEHVQKCGLLFEPQLIFSLLLMNVL